MQKANNSFFMTLLILIIDFYAANIEDSYLSNKFFSLKNAFFL